MEFGILHVLKNYIRIFKRTAPMLLTIKVFERLDTTIKSTSFIKLNRLRTIIFWKKKKL